MTRKTAFCVQVALVVSMPVWMPSAVKAQLDRQEVWCNPYVEFKGPHVSHKQDNWLFFFEKGPPVQ